MRGGGGGGDRRSKNRTVKRERKRAAAAWLARIPPREIANGFAREYNGKRRPTKPVRESTVYMKGEREGGSVSLPRGLASCTTLCDRVTCLASTRVCTVRFFFWEGGVRPGNYTMSGIWRTGEFSERARGVGYIFSDIPRARERGITARSVMRFFS